jgi:hypothetical protein
MSHAQRRHALALCGLLLLAHSARAQQQPWPFDLDPALAADPAGVEQRLAELGEGVPPIPPGELEAATVAPLTLYFHQAMLEQLELAFASGPGEQDPFTRTPALCAHHASFTMAELTSPASSASCRQHADMIRAAFDDDGQSCLRIEFPELYIYDQPPGEAATEDLQTVEGLIRIAGEVFTHIDWPAGLLPESFVSDARTIIAKVRYATLREQAVARSANYLAAQQLLETQAGCFYPSAALALSSQLADLVTELNNATAQLEALHAQGLQQAAAERQALAAQGRQRNDLPHPSLSDRERELLALYLGGIYWRMRGEALLAYPDSGLLRRLLYTQYPYQVIAELSGGVDAAELGRDIFIHENWGYFEWMDIGRNPGNDALSDMVDMAKRGKRTLTLAAPHLQERGYDTAPLYAGALQMGPCYFYAWERLWEPARYFRVGEDLTHPYVWFLESPTAHGEFCTGGALGVGLARALLRGKEGAWVDGGPTDAGDADAGTVGDDAGSPPTSDAGVHAPDGGSIPDDDDDGGVLEVGADQPGSPDEPSAPQCACASAKRAGLGFALWPIALAILATRSRPARAKA